MERGIAVAYAILIVTATVLAYIGAKFATSRVDKEGDSMNKQSSISVEQARLMPFFFSLSLFSLFIAFKFLPRNVFSTLINVYFAFVVCFSGGEIAYPILTKFIPATAHEIRIPIGFLNRITDVVARFLPFLFDEKKVDPDEAAEAKAAAADGKEVSGAATQTTDPDKDVFPVAIASILGMIMISPAVIAYYLTHHWMISNAFGIAFSITGTGLILLSSFSSGALMFGGLFVYDCFWVFATPVMVTVGKNLDLPIKLMVPKDVFDIDSSQMAILGLGDIVIPAIFLTMLLRYEKSHPGAVIFIPNVIGYAFALVVTVAALHMSSHAQPALLYIVPIMLAVTSVSALLQGRLKEVWSWSDKAAVEAGAAEWESSLTGRVWRKVRGGAALKEKEE